MADDEDDKIPVELRELGEALMSLSPKLDEMMIRHREQQEAWEREHGPRNAYLRAQAEEIFTMDGLECWIVKGALWMEREAKKESYERLRHEHPETYDLLMTMCGYCGYVLFPHKPVVEPEYMGIVAYIPVHGGVTYTHHDAVGSVYGFDTAHSNSENYPTRDKEWIRGQIDVLARGLLIAASIEEEYLKADGDNQKRADLIQPILDLQPGPLNMGTMLNLLKGEL